MVASQATVETGISSEESSLRKVSDAYTELAERKNWITKSQGLLGFARVLMDGADESEKSETSDYAAQVQRDAQQLEDQIALIRTDIEGAAHGLDVATMEVNKLFQTDRPARSLRADLLSYESALVTAKKARRTFVTTLDELALNDGNTASYALAQLDVSIDNARDAADKLASYAADRKSEESLS
jgi:hypothetical protein